MYSINRTMTRQYSDAPRSLIRAGLVFIQMDHVYGKSDLQWTIDPHRRVP